MQHWCNKDIAFTSSELSLRMTQSIFVTEQQWRSLCAQILLPGNSEVCPMTCLLRMQSLLTVCQCYFSPSIHYFLSCSRFFVPAAIAGCSQSSLVSWQSLFPVHQTCFLISVSAVCWQWFPYAVHTENTVVHLWNFSAIQKFFDGIPALPWLTFVTFSL